MLALAFDLLGVPFLKGLLIILAIILSLFAASDRLTPPAAPGAGDPRDIDPSLGEMRSGDIVIVKGEWIYDLHHGWNEIHPVLDCCILGHMDLGDRRPRDASRSAARSQRDRPEYGAEGRWPLSSAGGRPTDQAP